MIGDIYKNTPVSHYQPSDEVSKFTAAVKKDFSTGDDILHRGWSELNDRSVLEDENRGKLMFNAYVDPTFEDPNEAWKWRGTRSMARNKGIAMHANLTANFLLPLFIAQNENDEVDRDFSETMRDIIEWMAQPNVSNYQSSFLQMVFSMEQNPVTYLGAEYCEVFQKIREKNEDGKYTVKEILDEVLSGFQCPVYSPSQIKITNAYERNLQKQRRIIKQEFKDKSELEAKYGQHENWQYLQAGIKSIYSEDTGLFYDVKDEDHPFLVAEETALSRRDDSEVPFLNGIYFGDIENIENNPIKHRDNRGAPKYNVVPFGFHRIGEHFFFYKSMMNAMGWDNMYYDAMSEIVMNRAILETEMPMAVSGSDKIDSDIVFPNSVVAFENENTKITPLIPNSNMVAGFNALRETEKSMSDASVNETISGQLPEASQKAFTVAQAQANAKKLIGGVGKSLAESVVKYGDLMKDIALNHITVPKLDELSGEGGKIKYRSFLLQNKQSSGGKNVDRQIKFEDDLNGWELEKKERDYEEVKLLDGKDYNDMKESLRLINPVLFAKYNYLCKVDIEEMFAKNQEYMQPILLQLKQILAQDPYIDQETLDRKLIYAFFQTGGDDLIKKQPVSAMLPSANNPNVPVEEGVDKKLIARTPSGVV